MRSLLRPASALLAAVLAAAVVPVRAQEPMPASYAPDAGPAWRLDLEVPLQPHSTVDGRLSHDAAVLGPAASLVREESGGTRLGLSAQAAISVAGSSRLEQPLAQLDGRAEASRPLAGGWAGVGLAATAFPETESDTLSEAALSWQADPAAMLLTPRFELRYDLLASEGFAARAALTRAVLLPGGWQLRAEAGLDAVDAVWANERYGVAASGLAHVGGSISLRRRLTREAELSIVLMAGALVEPEIRAAADDPHPAGVAVLISRTL